MKPADYKGLDFYRVGPDELGEYDMDKIIESRADYRWVVYWYRTDSYDGEGLAVALRRDGKIDHANMGHCSCYGPTEKWPDETVDLKEFVEVVLRQECGIPRSSGDFDYEWWQAVGRQVRELIGGDDGQARS